MTWRLVSLSVAASVLIAVILFIVFGTSYREFSPEYRLVIVCLVGVPVALCLVLLHRLYKDLNGSPS
jgi:hypothetical protein